MVWGGSRVVALSLVVLAACGQSDMTVGKEKVRYVLKDGASAQFRNESVHVQKDRTIFCGEVNAKNAYGAYTGFVPFVVVGAVVVLEGADPVKVSPAGSASGKAQGVDTQSIIDALDVHNIGLELRNDLLRERSAKLQGGGDAGPALSATDYDERVRRDLVGKLKLEFCNDKMKS